MKNVCVCVCVCVCMCADFKDSGVSVVTPIFTDSLPEFKGLIITHLTLEHTLRQLRWSRGNYSLPILNDHSDLSWLRVLCIHFNPSIEHLSPSGSTTGLMEIPLRWK